MIETIYRLRLDYEYGARSNASRLTDALLHAANRGHVAKLHGVPDKASVFEGNGACGPHIIVEHVSYGAMCDLETELQRVIRLNSARIT